MASARKDRLRAIDDLRDMADAIEQAADRFEEAVEEIDTIAPGGVKMAKKQPKEDQERLLGAFSAVMPRELRVVAEKHVEEEHGPDKRDPECVVCQRDEGKLRKGWLSDIMRKMFRDIIREMIEAGEVEPIDEVQRERIRSAARRELREELENAEAML